MIGDPKRITPRSKAYKKYIESLDCLVCGRSPVIACHTGLPGEGGTSLKVSDFRMIPLCNPHHREQHAGTRSFAERHSLDYERIIIGLMERYIEQLERRAA